MADLLQRSMVKCKHFFKRQYSLLLPDDWLNQCVEFALESLEENSVRHEL